MDFWCNFGPKTNSSSKRVPPEWRDCVSQIHTLYTIRYTLYAIRHTRYAIKSTLNALRYRLYATRFMLHTISYTLHTIRCTQYILYALYAECGLKRFLSESKLKFKMSAAQNPPHQALSKKKGAGVLPAKRLNSSVEVLIALMF